MDTLELLKSRRSCRSYLNKPVEDELLSKVIEAGRYAPSGGNSQTTHFIVIKDKNVIDKLNELVKIEFSKMEINENTYKSLKTSITKSKEGTYRFSFDAPILIITANKIDYGNNMADCVCTIENMLIMANSLELGACYVNQLKWLNENKTIVDYLKTLGLQDDERVFASMTLGYASKIDHTPLPRTGNKVTII